MRKPFYFLLASLLLFSYLSGGGCSDSSITDDEPASVASSSGSSGGGTLPMNPPASMVVSITPSSGLSALGTATVSATVRDAAGAAVADGTTVTFAVGNSSLGSITPTATTVSGVANATFTAGSTAGTVGVTVTSGSVSASGSITILGADVGSIQFSSATPNVIGLKGSGQPETAVVIFSVKDVNGQPAPDGTSVTFTVDGPKGGETLVPTTASTKNGSATTILQSGTVAGAVRITASTVVNNVTVSSSSTGVSIGGGSPSLTHFDLSATLLRLAGFSYNNLESTVTAYVADRFGNYNVLTGTTVSFYTEAGAIDRNNVTNDQGLTSVLFRTQDPRPTDVPVDINQETNGYTCTKGSPPSSTTCNPRDGWTTILATTIGEETFTDSNGNGVFDTGEPFVDIGEPFIDGNDDGVFNAGEFYIDFDQNGAYTPANGRWDGNAMIWTEIKLTFTGGNPSFGPDTSRFADISGTEITTFRILNGSSQNIRIYVSDFNQNYLPPDSTINITNSGGKLTGGGIFKLADGISDGPFFVTVNLSDTDSSSKKQDTASITVDITTNVASIGTVTHKMTLTGFVDFGPAITTASLPNGTSSGSYSTTVQAAGGTTPYTWSATGLPAGLSIDGSTGVISGTITAPAATYNVTITVTDSSTPTISDAKAFTLAVS